MRPLGDRRAHVRLEVVGALWGTLELSETADVLNISTTGALIESPVPAVPDASQLVILVIDDEELTVETSVRHSKRVVPESDPPQYLIGLEFVSPPTGTLDRAARRGVGGRFGGCGLAALTRSSLTCLPLFDKAQNLRDFRQTS
jgi:hypothetical protein